VARPTSVLYDVIGPIMRGPSSSHTAGPYHIGRLVRSLLADDPKEAVFTFDPSGSFAEVYRQQGSDLGFVAGILGWEITDERFPRALEAAAVEGVHVRFEVGRLPGAEHPNVVQIVVTGRDNSRLEVVGQSVGGGSVILTNVQGWPMALTGDAYDVLVEMVAEVAPAVQPLVARWAGVLQELRRGDVVFLHGRCLEPVSQTARHQVQSIPGVRGLWVAEPLRPVPHGRPLFGSAAEMNAWAEQSGCSLGQAVLAYEAALLRMPPESVMQEMVRRYRVMRAAVERGLKGEARGLRLLAPSAEMVFRAEADGRLAVGGLHARAAARALAVMHVNASGGVVCAAPTAGSAGVLPAIAVTLADELGVDERGVALALLAAGGIGLVVAWRATFAAEVAGCQVEIGAAGAMAAAAVAEAAGATAAQATHAAAIAFQNSMGSVCDLVQGRVEIPCHTRNAVAASSAFVCADLILGGYANPIPLDETVDAVLAVGRMLPRELRCTALGGLAQTPSALALARDGPRASDYGAAAPSRGSGQ